MSNQVFLGGTCNGSLWRDALIPMLTVSYYNPVVEDWTPDCMDEEIRQREECSVCLYVITPAMTGVFSIAEVVDDSNKRPEKTVFTFVDDVSVDGNGVASSFSPHQIKSLNQVGRMVKDNGGAWIEWGDLPKYLNATT